MMSISSVRRLVLSSMCLFCVCSNVCAGLREDYEASEFEFLRTDSNLPTFPFSWLNYTARGDSVIQSGDEELKYDQSSGSQFFAMPVWIDRDDMVLLGEYVSKTRFSPVDRVGTGADVYSTGFGGAWLRQASTDWQCGAFAAPYGSSGFNDDSSWNWQIFGGAGALYYGQADVLWVFAGIMDYTEEQTYVLPYAGFSWTITPEWALNMILPWPSVTYAPTRDLLFNAGAAPSGGTWRMDDTGQDLAVSLSGWDVGAGAEYRLWKIGWIYARAGIGGFRGLEIATDGEMDMEAAPEPAPFVSAGIDLRM